MTSITGSTHTFEPGAEEIPSGRHRTDRHPPGRETGDWSPTAARCPAAGTLPAFEKSFRINHQRNRGTTS